MKCWLTVEEHLYACGQLVHLVEEGAYHCDLVVQLIPDQFLVNLFV